MFKNIYIITMTKLKIKYPTLITSKLDSHHMFPQEMVDDVLGIIKAYGKRLPENKEKIKYRGKSRIKTIESIDFSTYTIGSVPCIQLCVRESKTGQENMYLQKAGENDENQIAQNDKLGSSQNYALLYPLVDQKVSPENKWLIIIYVTPGKDDADMVNTFKNVVNKIFSFPFKYIIPVNINHQRVVPKIEVTLSTIENVDFDQFVRKDLIVNCLSKSTQKVEYLNIEADAAEEILNDNKDVNGRTTRKVRFFHNLSNKHAYTTYTFNSEDNGVINSIMTTKYSEYDEIVPDELRTLYEPQIMRGRFARVLTNYLSNGADGQDRPNVTDNATGDR